MAHGFNKLLKKITKDVSYDELIKRPIPDAENKLYVFKEVTFTTSSALESYLKSLSKSVDNSLKEKFDECLEQFKKTDKNDFLLSLIIAKVTDAQKSIALETSDLKGNLEKFILEPLVRYQKDASGVKDNLKDLKEAYDKVEALKSSIDKARKEAENYRRTMENARINNDTRKQYDTFRALSTAEDKCTKIEKDLDEATSSANEKYDKYTESLFKKVSEEHDLAQIFLEYVRCQQQFHYNAYKRLESIIPQITQQIKSSAKKPLFGNPIDAFDDADQYPVSPLVRKLIEAMIRQDAFNEEGLFRMAGSRVKMNRLISSINAGYLDVIDLSEYDVHCLASVLKQYIRDLPDSLLCSSLSDEWSYAVNCENKFETIKQTLNKLPKRNYETLKYIVKFLSQVIDNSEKTKMTSTNMGICFGASLSSSSSNEENKSIDMSIATTVFEYILSNHLDLFPNDVDLPKLQITPSPRGISKPSPETPVSYMNRNPELLYRQSVMTSELRNELSRSTMSLSQNTEPSQVHPSASVRHAKKSSMSESFQRFEQQQQQPTSDLKEQASPRARPKKQAPAPPPHNATLASSTSTSSLNSSLNATTTTITTTITTSGATPSSNETTPTSISGNVTVVNKLTKNDQQQQDQLASLPHISLFPSIKTNNDGNGENNANNNNNSSSLNSSNSSSNSGGVSKIINKINIDQQLVAPASPAPAPPTPVSLQVQEKPPLPPPVIPVRPPPIGFSALITAEMTTTQQNFVASSPPQSDESGIYNPSLVKPSSMKPSLPRKPTVPLAQIINNGNSNNNANNNQEESESEDEDKHDSDAQKSAEVTSL